MPEQGTPDGARVGRVGISLLVGYVLLLALLTFMSLVVLWPPIRSEGKTAAQEALENPNPPPTAAQAQAEQAVAAPSTSTPTPCPTPGSKGVEADQHKRIWNESCLDVCNRPRSGVNPLKLPFMEPRCVYDEDRLFLIVLFAGALGGLVYSLRSLSWYIGNRELKWSWTVLYFLTPFTSAAIALVFYFVVRGGFFSPSSSVSDTNPAFFAALAALIGLFTEQAINKLKSVAETVLAPKEQGKDHIGPTPVVPSISPPSGPTAGGTEVSIGGDNFQAGAVVTFGGELATVLDIQPKLIKVNTPPHAAGKVDVIVTNTDNQKQVFANGFEYKDELPGQPAQPAGPGQPAQPAGQQPPSPPPPPPGQTAAGPPTISSLQPAAGDKTGGEQLTITGTNFVERATVTLGGREAENVTVIDAETLTLLTPAADTEGDVEVVVTTPGGTSPAAGFTYTSGVIEEQGAEP